MARILWLNWSGGGNLPPSLGIARVLTERGHEVAFAGRPEMVPRVKTAGFRAIEITHAYAQVDRYPQGHFMTRAACYLTSPAVEEQVRAIVAAEAPDLVLIDAMFPAALAEAPALRAADGRVRAHLRVPPARHVAQHDRDARRHARSRRASPACRRSTSCGGRAIASSRPASPTSMPRPSAGWEMVRHVGPVLEDEKVRGADAAAVARGRSDAARPGEFQHRLRAAQRRQAAARARCAGRAAGPRRRDDRRHRRAERAAPRRRTPSCSTTPRTIRSCGAPRLIVTHGGHGTAMRALRHGVPMVVIPGLAGDQPFVAAAVQEWGAGRALPGDACHAAIRAAAQRGAVHAVVSRARAAPRGGARGHRRRGQRRRRSRSAASSCRRRSAMLPQQTAAQARRPACNATRGRLRSTNPRTSSSRL